MFISSDRSSVLACLTAALLMTTAVLALPRAAEAQPAEQPIVAELRRVLDLHPDIAHALVTSLERADWRGITTLDDYFGYLNEAVTRIPVASSLLEDAVEFYYLINQSEALRRSEPFQQWVVRLVEDWGELIGQKADGDPDARLERAYLASRKRSP
jgi:hypothetical protein